MDVAMALATLFFVLLLLSSAAISLLLIRLCLAALRPSATTRTPYAAVDPETVRASPPQHALALLPPTKAPKETPAEPRRLAWREVEELTGGFDEAAVVARGGSGNAVYLARERVGGSAAAVKVHRWCGGGERRLAAFRRELDLLRRVGRHPRLVALLAYSDDHEEGGALVLEYMPGGTLADRLHGAAPPLTWRHRLRVVHDTALALEHLHGTATAIVHGDLSASNVLLDDVGGARLCDLGSACEATFSAAVAPARRGAAAAVGSPGYADPFFLRTGIVSKKSDVYSFGVLLLEVVTGSPAAGTSEGGGEYLTARVLPRVRATGVAGLVDSRLGDCYDTIEAIDIARIALECLASQPGLRPTMAQVRAVVAEKAARSIASDGSDHKLLDLFRATS
ncbi:hypothetical protein QYE76_019396 [Lolium multiflorum]|uniref:Protein kinase domain-containing protein n=1 Tax=Lolium multiflorum TaxID=4521 RepID=A0AAD8VP24_LOLMU|nr:hypothetical protein QYE76_019396 [Lolium multiflorum]